MTVNFNKNDFLVNMDKYSEYVPIISYITLFVNAIQNQFLISKMDTNELDANEYLKNISMKTSERMLILLVPIFGNIIVAIMDIQSKSTHEQNSQNQETTLPSNDVNDDQQSVDEMEQDEVQSSDENSELLDPEPEDWGLTTEDLNNADTPEFSSIMQDQLDSYAEYFFLKDLEAAALQANLLDPEPEDYPIPIEELFPERAIKTLTTH